MHSREVYCGMYAYLWDTVSQLSVRVVGWENDLVICEFETGEEIKVHPYDLVRVENPSLFWPDGVQ